MWPTSLVVVDDDDDDDDDDDEGRIRSPWSGQRLDTVRACAYGSLTSWTDRWSGAPDS